MAIDEDFAPNTMGAIERRREAAEPRPVAHLVFYPGATGSPAARAALRSYGRGTGPWLSALITDGEAPGHQLVYCLEGFDNVAVADRLITAFRVDGLIRRGLLAEEHSRKAWLSLEGGAERAKHYRYESEFMWHLCPGAGNVLAEFLRIVAPCVVQKGRGTG